MPNREPNPDLFRRWLIVVYLPLAVFVLALALVVGRILTGGIVWLVGLLGLYCVIPVRLILETQRKGLELPMPPSSVGARSRRSPVRDRRSTVPLGDIEDLEPDARRPSPVDEGEPRLRERAAEARRPSPVDEGEPRLRERAAEARRPLPADEGEPPVRRRSVEARRARPANEISEPVERPQRPQRAAPRRSPQMVRRRALASVIGIGVLLLVGGILVIVGIGRVTSSFGLVMVGVGGFLMILSVTLPTFRLVDAILRAVGRLISRQPAEPRSSRPRTNKRRSA